jgi:alginate O-acetyltransferase complex protein AlgI
VRPVVFSSIVFVFYFLPIVLALHFAVPRRLRNAVLLLASLCFYAWGEQDRIAILLASIVVAWAGGRAIGPPESPRGWRARVALWGVVLASLGLVGFYKYLGFAVANGNALLSLAGAPPLAVAPVVMPLGISFFTFQALSYVIDVYRGDVAPERSLFRFALYKSFFPQLIAGPIVRYRDVAAQFGTRRITRADLVAGIRRFVVGLGKKVLIANTAATTADAIFAIPAAELTASVAWLGLACYTLQIYFDFSGYSDMAIGLARMFGFRFLENFRWPYAAASMTDFWRRWHISLSTWFRDYVYVPLGGNRLGRVRTGVNLLVVFFLCGLWHGAAWTFVLWGLFHGVFLLAERAGLGAWLDRAVAPVRHVYVVVAVMLGWVLFRSESLPGALGYYAALAGASGSLGLEHPLAMYADGECLLVLAAGFLGSVPWLPWMRARVARWEETLAPRASAGLVLAHESAVLASLALIFVAAAARLASGTHNPFIYFRF